jgi:hypothetical protein
MAASKASQTVDSTAVSMVTMMVGKKAGQMANYLAA